MVGGWYIGSDCLYSQYKNTNDYDNSAIKLFSNGSISLYGCITFPFSSDDGYIGMVETNIGGVNNQSQGNGIGFSYGNAVVKATSVLTGMSFNGSQYIYCNDDAVHIGNSLIVKDAFSVISSNGYVTYLSADNNGVSISGDLDVTGSLKVNGNNIDDIFTNLLSIKKINNKYVFINNVKYLYKKVFIYTFFIYVKIQER